MFLRIANFSYSFKYENANFAEGKSLAGNDVTLGISGTPTYPAASYTIYIPQNIIIGGIYSPWDKINKSSDVALTWAPDSRNLNGRAYIQVYYYPGISMLNNPLFPANINSLTYDTEDDGSFVIPSSDLQRFPVNSYLGITIARGTVYQAEVQYRRRYVYCTITDTRTIPLLLKP